VRVHNNNYPYNFDSYIFVDWRDAGYTSSLDEYQDEDLWLYFRLTSYTSGTWTWYSSSSGTNTINAGASIEIWNTDMKKVTGPPGIPIQLTSPTGYVYIAGQSSLSAYHGVFTRNTSYQVASYDPNTSQPGISTNLVPDLIDFSASYSFPSTLANIAVGIYFSGGFAYPQVSWTASSDYDVINGGNIIVERRINVSYQGWSAWGTLATLSGSSTSYIDYSIKRACQGTCPDQVQYRLAARDIGLLNSVYSSVACITAYGTQYQKAIDVIDSPSLVVPQVNGPSTFEPLVSYPNPANPSTMLQYALPFAAHVELVVFNNIGQEVVRLVDGQQEAGYHGVLLTGLSLSSGIYFARLQVSDELRHGVFHSVSKVLFMK
jgi:hypothetical protein